MDETGTTWYVARAASVGDADEISPMTAHSERMMKMVRKYAIVVHNRLTCILHEFCYAWWEETMKAR
jgi:hypothetical protein